MHGEGGGLEDQRHLILVMHTQRWRHETLSVTEFFAPLPGKWDFPEPISRLCNCMNRLEIASTYELEKHDCLQSVASVNARWVVQKLNGLDVIMHRSGNPWY